MRYLLASALLRVHVYMARRHVIETGYKRCAECYNPWPCYMRRETDARVRRHAGVSR